MEHEADLASSPPQNAQLSHGLSSFITQTHTALEPAMGFVILKHCTCHLSPALFTGQFPLHEPIQVTC